MLIRLFQLHVDTSSRSLNHCVKTQVEFPCDRIYLRTKEEVLTEEVIISFFLGVCVSHSNFR